MKAFICTYGGIFWALIAACVILLSWFAFLPEEGINNLFSSDALYLPMLYRDFFQDGYTLIGWTLNQASNFFPDMLLFFLLEAILGNFIAATFCYSVIQFFAIILFFYLIFKQTNSEVHPATFAPAIFLFASFLFLYFIDNLDWLSALLIHNSFHLSAFIMALASLYLFLKFFDTKSWKTLAVIFLISFLSGACDRLFFVCFSIPASLVVVSLYFFNRDRKAIIKILITIILGVFCAIVLYIFFIKNPYFTLTKAYGEFSIEHIRSSWGIFTRQMKGYLSTPSFIMFLTYLSLFSYFATAIYVCRETYKLVKAKRDICKMLVFQLFVLFFTPIVILTPILTGSYGGIDTIRYNFFPYLLLPFNAVILVSNKLNKNKLLRITLNIVMPALMIGYLLVQYPAKEFFGGLKSFFNFYPKKAQVIDVFFDNNDTFKYGITNEYWTAKQVTMFSKKNVRLYFAFDNGVPWLHVANRHWFIEHDAGKHAHCKFSFLLWSQDKEPPDIFQTMNDNMQPIALENWYMYNVKPYRFIVSGTRFYVEPVLIETTLLSQ